MTMFVFRLAALWIVCVTFLSACGPVIALPPAVSIDAPLSATPQSSYAAMPGDTIKLRVYGENDLSAGYIIDQNGAINMPMIGAVPVAGLNEKDIEKTVRDRLVKSGYFTHPIITADITSARMFYILGEIKSPGTYPCPPSIAAIKAIAIAGGYTPRAAQGMMLIDRRMPDGGVQRMNANENTPLMPHDTIIVRERIL